MPRFRLCTPAVAALLAIALTGLPALCGDDAPIIEYALVHHMLADPAADAAPPLLAVYADGRVRVHRAAFLSRAGDYELTLAPADVSGLLSSLAGTGLLALDLEAARELRRQAQGGALYHVSDVTETVIRIRLGAEQPRGPELPSGVIDATVRWPNVYTDRRRFPDLLPVAVIADAESQLRALLNRPDLARVAP